MKPRFTLRDLFWLVLVVAMAVNWHLQSHRLHADLNRQQVQFDQRIREEQERVQNYRSERDRLYEAFSTSQKQIEQLKANYP